MKGLVISVGNNGSGNSNILKHLILGKLVFREDSLEATEILSNNSLDPKQSAKKFAVV